MSETLMMGRQLDVGKNNIKDGILGSRTQNKMVCAVGLFQHGNKIILWSCIAAK